MPVCRVCNQPTEQPDSVCRRPGCPSCDDMRLALLQVPCEHLAFLLFAQPTAGNFKVLTPKVFYCGKEIEFRVVAVNFDWAMNCFEFKLHSMEFEPHVPGTTMRRCDFVIEEKLIDIPEWIPVGDASVRPEHVAPPRRICPEEHRTTHPVD